MRTGNLILVGLLGTASLLNAQPAAVQGPQAPEPPPTYEMDKGGKQREHIDFTLKDRKSTRLNSSHMSESRMPSSA